MNWLSVLTPSQWSQQGLYTVYQSLVSCLEGHLVLSKILRIHLVHAKMSLKFGPVQNDHTDTRSTVNRKPALLPDLKRDHLPNPMCHYQTKSRRVIPGNTATTQE